MIKVLVADIAATILVFMFSVLLKNSSVYDAYWSVIPPFIALYLILLNSIYIITHIISTHVDKGDNESEFHRAQ